MALVDDDQELTGFAAFSDGLFRFIRRLIVACMLGGVLVVGLFVAYVYFVIYPDLPDVEDLQRFELEVPMRVYSSDDKLMGEFGKKLRIKSEFSDFPDVLIDAVVSIEDRLFWQHNGVNLKSIGRAVVGKLTGRPLGGGSTIDMQVARNYYGFTRKVDYQRKIKEMILAWRMNDLLSKEQIMELYLNKIFLGQRAYGAGAASHVYYGKTLKDLTLAEAAMIAGLPQAPSKNNPISNPKTAIKRRDLVLRRMLEEEKIDQQKHDLAVQAPNTARVHKADIEVQEGYISEMARQYMVDRFGDDVDSSGYKVYTTIDSKLQDHAANAIRNGIQSYERRHGYFDNNEMIDANLLSDPVALQKALRDINTIGDLQPAVVISVSGPSAGLILDGGVSAELSLENAKWAGLRTANLGVGKRPKSLKSLLQVGELIYVRKRGNAWVLAQKPTAQSALVAMEPKTGRLLALVGGYDFYDSKFNRATLMRRQVGSSFKPFLYSAALDAGDTPATIYNDAPVRYEGAIAGGKDWTPKNYDGKFKGPMRLREALVRSSNLVSIRVLEHVGVARARDFARRFSFEDETLSRNMGLALGSGAASPLQMANAYSVFANQGYATQPIFVTKVTTYDDQPIDVSVLTMACRPELCPDDPLVQPAPKVLTDENAFLMRSMLRDVIKRGTAAKANRLGRPDLGGKTGTTNDTIDAWFIGSNQDIVASVWVGRDDNTTLGKKETGGAAALPIWMDFMANALKDKPITQDKVPEGIVSKGIDPETGYLVEGSKLTEYFVADNLPPVGVGGGTELSLPVLQKPNEIQDPEAPQQPVDEGLNATESLF